MKLPKGWTDFKIVEVEPGVFTSRIYIDKPTQEQIDNWNKDGIKTLQAFTKELLENIFGYKIESVQK